MALIAIENLTKRYRGKRGRTVQALTDLSLSVNEGEVFGFLGPNGAGKSTTIKTLMGLIRPTAGNATLCGLPATDARARERVGYLPENPAFYDFLTAREYLAFVGSAFRMEAARLTRESERVLALVELQEAADRPIRGFSKGMVQRLGLAQALLHDPDLYILDEPMSGLDPLGRALVKEIIRELKGRRKTVFFSTHITADVEAVCDRVGIIVSGRLQAVEAVEEVLRSGVVGYLVQVRDCPAEVYASFDHQPVAGGMVDVYVPREGFNRFIEEATAKEGTIELVEPKRKDLEAFFLEVVERGRG